jgi:hypothetical protein
MGADADSKVGLIDSNHADGGDFLVAIVIVDVNRGSF